MGFFFLLALGWLGDGFDVVVLEKIVEVLDCMSNLRHMIERKMSKTRLGWSGQKSEIDEEMAVTVFQLRGFVFVFFE